MLGVTKEATDAELKRAYKKKCLKVHPDKNNAPEADEAFKKINAAMACLSDPVKRRQYNQMGNSDMFERRESTGGTGNYNRSNHGHNFHRGNFGGYNDDDFTSAEDFFKFMFFGERPRPGPRRNQ